MLENIHKKVEKVSLNFKHQLMVQKEVLFAILSTSVVLISIFMPIIFLEGDTAKLFLELSITIISAVFFYSNINNANTNAMFKNFESFKTEKTI